MHLRIDIVTERNATTDFAADVGEKLLHQSIGYVLQFGGAIDSVIKRDLCSLLEELRPQNALGLDGLRSLPDVVGTIATGGSPRCFVGTIVAARCPDDQDQSVLIRHRKEHRMISRTDPVTLSEYLSLNLVYVATLQATRRENGISNFVFLNAQDHVPAVQIQQVVGEGTDRLDDRRLGSRIPGGLEFAPVVLDGAGMDQVLDGYRQAALDSGQCCCHGRCREGSTESTREPTRFPCRASAGLAGPRPLLVRIGGVAQAVAEEVEGEHGDDHEAGRDQ